MVKTSYFIFVDFDVNEFITFKIITNDIILILNTIKICILFSIKIEE